ncbi:MAG: MFS transporter [Gammaproteobacteria bacterium]|nr:MFS transporter [Gammaproteobacteria bacterium]
MDSTSSAPWMRRYVLGILLVVYTFNFIDRQILSILLEAIKHDLGLSDQALGFLSGFAFAAFYATLGIPMALWADRGNRRNLIAASLALWSAMTAACGLAQNFVHLALARVGVGIGEAGCSPPSHSIISDYYPARERATAIGIYALGIPFGIMFGLFLGGWINELFGWRKAFFIVGLPGLALAVLVRLTVPEPRRGLADARADSAERPSIMETVRFLKRRPAFLHLSFGAALACFVGYGFIAWFPSFLIRSHHMKTTDIGLWLGLLIGVVGGIGMFVGGVLADRFSTRDMRWSAWIVTVANLVGLPFGLFAYLADDPYVALALFVPPIIAANFWQATTLAQAQSMVRLRMRAQTSAILLFIANIIGLGAGPWAIGAVSDLLAPSYGADSLRYSLLGFSVLGLWVAWHYYLGGKHLQADMARAEAMV